MPRLDGGNPVSEGIDGEAAEHVAHFGSFGDQTQLAHLIEHGASLRHLRGLDDAELVEMHDAHHCTPGENLVPAPDLTASAEKLLKLAAGLREHVIAGRWSEAYAAADWVGDIADEIGSHVWAAHPTARPENW